MKTLGIIGGMGPQASIRFLDLVIRRCIKTFGVKENDEFPRIIMSNLPAPDLIVSRKKEKKARRMLAEEAQKLETAGADFLVMTCNTMHILSNVCTDAVSIPFLSMIETVVRQAVADRRTCVGLLGSLTTMTSDLYRAPLQNASIEVVTPSAKEQIVVVHCIKNVIAGKNTEKDAKALQRIILGLQKRGAEAVILGCTELPLIIDQTQTDVPLLDSLELLAVASSQERFPVLAGKMQKQ